MSVFRVPKRGNYTIMSNIHLRDPNLSLKAKGMLSIRGETTMRQRDIRFEAFLSEEEALHLEQLHQVSGLPKSTIVRKLICGCDIKPQPPESYHELAAQLSCIGNNLNQIAHVANLNANITPQQINEVQSIMSTVWQYVAEQF